MGSRRMSALVRGFVYFKPWTSKTASFQLSIGLGVPERKSDLIRRNHYGLDEVLVA